MRLKSALLVALPHLLTDDVLTTLLTDVSDALRSGKPWHDIPQWGLITGRDIRALQAFASRLTEDQIDPPVNSNPVLRLDMAGHHQTERSELLDIFGNQSYRRQSITSIVDDDREEPPVSVLVIQTHGSESCAKGTAGLVYCGRARGDIPSIETDGGFACGRGWPCPRGPRPRSVSPMADVLMMAVCGGLRLGDNINHDAFSFALNFVDGQGRAFISSISTNSGAPLAAVAFLATLADGGSLGAATLMANAVPTMAGIDDPTYLLIGDPEHRPVQLGEILEPLCVEALPVQINAVGKHHQVIVLRQTDHADLLSVDSLTVTAASASAPEIIGFTRRVAMPGAANSVVEVHLFSFPEPLGVLTLGAFWRGQIERRLRASLAFLDAWLERWRMLGLDRDAPDEFSALADTCVEVRTGVAKTVPLLGVSGTLAGEVEARAEYIEVLAAAAGFEAVNLLSPRLGTSFWLSNALAAQYSFIDSQIASCPSCGRQARARVLRHGACDSTRVVLVCNRCGISQDSESLSTIGRVSIEPETIARPGEVFALRLRIDTSRAAAAQIAVRLTMPGQESPEPIDPVGKINLDHGRTDVTVRFALPDTTAPHRYYIKVLIAVRDDLVFACRPFFVLPPVQE